MPLKYKKVKRDVLEHMLCACADRSAYVSVQFYCEQCKDFMCEYCRKSHNRRHSFRRIRAY